MQLSALASKLHATKVGELDFILPFPLPSPRFHTFSGVQQFFSSKNA